MLLQVRDMWAGDESAVAEVSYAAQTMFDEAELDLPPGDPWELIKHAEQVLVAETEEDSSWRIVGLAATTTVDGELHLQELAVDPAVGRRGVGSHLLEQVCWRAQRDGCPAVTLTTFRDLPWNGPWYTRRGFHTLPETEWGPQLRQVWEQQSQIRVAPRVVMRREV